MGKQKTTLFDSTVLVDYLRGKSAAKELLLPVLYQKQAGAISLLTVTELLIGVKDQNDDLKRHTVLFNYFEKISINKKIAYRAGQLGCILRQANENGPKVPDLIIAATGEYFDMDIVTRNAKHFECMPLKSSIKIINYSV